MKDVNKMNLDGVPTENTGKTIPLYSGTQDASVSISNVLFGTLEIEGEGSYYAFLAQTRTQKTWVLTDTDIFDDLKKARPKIQAVLRSFNTGRLEGYGKTFLLTRLMSNLSTMVYQCVNNSEVQNGFLIKGEYTNQQTVSFIAFTTFTGGRNYEKLELVYEGFKLNLTPYRNKLPFSLPTLSPVQDSKSKAAVIANLGIKTAASLFRQMGDRLDWYKKKNYTLIDSNEKFEQMMYDLESPFI